MENTPNPHTPEQLYRPQALEAAEFLHSVHDIEGRLYARILSEEEIAQECRYLESELGVPTETPAEMIAYTHISDSHGEPTGHEAIVSEEFATYYGIDILPLGPEEEYKVALVFGAPIEGENIIYYAQPHDIVKFIPESTESDQPYDSEILQIGLRGHAMHALETIASMEYRIANEVERRSTLERLSREAELELLATYVGEEVALFAREYYTVETSKKNWGITRHEQKSKRPTLWTPLSGFIMGCSYPELHDPHYSGDYLSLTHDFPSIAFQSSDGEQLYFVPVTAFEAAYVLGFEEDETE